MKGSTWAWILGAVLVVLVALGFWWHGRTQSVAGLNMPASSTSTSTAPDNSQPTQKVVSQTRTGSVVAVIDSIPDASRFARLLGTSGVATKLTGAGPYTIFVPINEAYGYLPAGTLENLSPAQLTRLVEYHIIKGKTINVNVEAAGTVTAMSGDELNFNVRQGDKSARVNSSVVLQSYKADNGIIYLVDQVLQPPVSAQ